MADLNPALIMADLNPALIMANLNPALIMANLNPTFYYGQSKGFGLINPSETGLLLRRLYYCDAFTNPYLRLTAAQGPKQPLAQSGEIGGR